MPKTCTIMTAGLLENKIDELNGADSKSRCRQPAQGNILAYLTLFFTALAAATLLPAYSEILVGGMVTQGYSLWQVWFWATAGNTAGSVINGVIGRQVDRFKHKRWFPVSEKQLEKARDRFNHYGQWSLLLGWLPIAGDPLTLVGGVMRVPWLNFVVLVGIGKGLRYGLVIWLMLEASGTPGSP